LRCRATAPPPLTVCLNDGSTWPSIALGVAAAPGVPWCSARMGKKEETDVDGGNLESAKCAGCV
jgi:hypothetical protein